MSKRGENIYKRKDGRWEGRYKLDTPTAKYKYVYGTTYKEVKTKMITLKNEMQSTNESTIKFYKLSERWIESIRCQIKESSMVKYKNLLKNHINPYFANMNIHEIRRIDIELFVTNLRTNGNIKNGKNLSEKSIKDILIVLSSIIKYGKKSGLNINELDIKDISIKRERHQIKTLSQKERQNLESYLLNDRTPSKCAILLSLYCGMRIGEICALRWHDIDLLAGTITVNSTMQRLQDMENSGTTKIVISEPKTHTSKRIIPIPLFLLEILKDLKLENEMDYLATGTQFFIEPRTLENHFKKYLRECNIRDTNFHTLRHTFATRCVEVGFDIKSLSEILGHTNVTTTLNLYAHPSFQHKQDYMNKLTPNI